jgi:hypothetical protein
MHLAWLSDIHLDFVDEAAVERLGRETSATKARLAVVTGDVALAASVIDKLAALAGAARMPIYFVLGNHDFYGGRIAEVRKKVRGVAPPLCWLPAAGPIDLAPGTWLVGCDGWGDARHGTPDRSRVMLNDFVKIGDLVDCPPGALHAQLRALGDAEGETLRGLIDRVPKNARSVIVATHVPPFKEACWYDGKVSDDEWLPFFTCAATGEVLRAAAAERRGTHFLVLCGHTHGGGIARLSPNLEVRTAEADYGNPQVAGIIDCS